MVNPQVSMPNLNLEVGIPSDVMWSLINGKHSICVMTDCLWIGLMIAWMRR